MPWIEVHTCALSDRTGTARFLRDAWQKGGCLSESPPGPRWEQSTVPVVTLDEFAHTYCPTGLDFIKLDAAGNERAALLGGQTLLRSARRPTLLVKFYHPDVVWQRFRYDAREVEQLLRAWGFALYEVGETQLREYVGPVRTYGECILATPPPGAAR